MTSSRVSTLVIRTPEGIAFSLLLACPVTRSLAWIVDFACITALCSALGLILAFTSVVSADFARAITLLSYFVVQIGYGITCEWLWRGATIGKRLLRLRVMDVQGLNLQFNQVVLRNLLRFVDCMPACYLVGGMVALFNARGQRLGDLAANTIVVRHVQLPEPDVDQIMAGKYNSLREYPHLEARLRQRISPREAGVALQAILRRDELNPDARVELFDDIAAYFREVVPFPPEAVENITAEQYVRNVVEVLFRPRRR